MSKTIQDINIAIGVKTPKDLGLMQQLDASTQKNVLTADGLDRLSQDQLEAFKLANDLFKKAQDQGVELAKDATLIKHIIAGNHDALLKLAEKRINDVDGTIAQVRNNMQAKIDMDKQMMKIAKSLSKSTMFKDSQGKAIENNFKKLEKGFVTFDIESNFLMEDVVKGDKAAQIFQVAAIKYNKLGKEIGRFEKTIQAESAEALAKLEENVKKGITSPELFQQIKDSKDSLEDVLTQYVQFMGDDLVKIGHNITTYDIPALKHFFDKLQIPNTENLFKDTIDTYQMSLDVLETSMHKNRKHEKSGNRVGGIKQDVFVYGGGKQRETGAGQRKLEVLYEVFKGTELENAHDALADIMANKEVLFELMKLAELKEAGEEDVINEVIEKTQKVAYEWSSRKYNRHHAHQKKADQIKAITTRMAEESKKMLQKNAGFHSEAKKTKNAATTLGKVGAWDDAKLDFGSFMGERAVTSRAEQIIEGADHGLSILLDNGELFEFDDSVKEAATMQDASRLMLEQLREAGHAATPHILDKLRMFADESKVNFLQAGQFIGEASFRLLEQQLKDDSIAFLSGDSKSAISLAEIERELSSIGLTKDSDRSLIDAELKKLLKTDSFGNFIPVMDRIKHQVGQLKSNLNFDLKNAEVLLKTAEGISAQIPAGAGGTMQTDADYYTVDGRVWGMELEKYTEALGLDGDFFKGGVDDAASRLAALESGGLLRHAKVETASLLEKGKNAWLDNLSGQMLQMKLEGQEDLLNMAILPQIGGLMDDDVVIKLPEWDTTGAVNEFLGFKEMTVGEYRKEFGDDAFVKNMDGGTLMDSRLFEQIGDKNRFNELLAGQQGRMDFLKGMFIAVNGLEEMTYDHVSQMGAQIVTFAGEVLEDSDGNATGVQSGGGLKIKAEGLMQQFLNKGRISYTGMNNLRQFQDVNKAGNVSPTALASIHGQDTVLTKYIDANAQHHKDLLALDPEAVFDFFNAIAQEGENEDFFADVRNSVLSTQGRVLHSNKEAVLEAINAHISKITEDMDLLRVEGVQYTHSMGDLATVLSTISLTPDEHKQLQAAGVDLTKQIMVGKELKEDAAAGHKEMQQKWKRYLSLNQREAEELKKIINNREKGGLAVYDREGNVLGHHKMDFLGRDEVAMGVKDGSGIRALDQMVSGIRYPYSGEHQRHHARAVTNPWLQAMFDTGQFAGITQKGMFDWSTLAANREDFDGDAMQWDVTGDQRYTPRNVRHSNKHNQQVLTATGNAIVNDKNGRRLVTDGDAVGDVVSDNRKASVTMKDAFQAQARDSRSTQVGPIALALRSANETAGFVEMFQNRAVNKLDGLLASDEDDAEIKQFIQTLNTFVRDLQATEEVATQVGLLENPMIDIRKTGEIMDNYDAFQLIQNGMESLKESESNLAAAVAETTAMKTRMVKFVPEEALQGKEWAFDADTNTLMTTKQYFEDNRAMWQKGIEEYAGMVESLMTEAEKERMAIVSVTPDNRGELVTIDNILNKNKATSAVIEEAKLRVIEAMKEASGLDSVVAGANIDDAVLEGQFKKAAEEFVRTYEEAAVAVGGNADNLTSDATELHSLLTASMIQFEGDSSRIAEIREYFKKDIEAFLKTKEGKATNFKDVDDYQANMSLSRIIERFSTEEDGIAAEYELISSRLRELEKFMGQFDVVSEEMAATFAKMITDHGEVLKTRKDGTTAVNFTEKYLPQLSAAFNGATAEMQIGALENEQVWNQMREFLLTSNEDVKLHASKLLSAFEDNDFASLRDGSFKASNILRAVKKASEGLAVAETTAETNQIYRSLANTGLFDGTKFEELLNSYTKESNRELKLINEAIANAQGDKKEALERAKAQIEGVVNSDEFKKLTEQIEKNQAELDVMGHNEGGPWTKKEFISVAEALDGLREQRHNLIDDLFKDHKDLQEQIKKSREEKAKIFNDRALLKELPDVATTLGEFNLIDTTSEMYRKLKDNLIEGMTPENMKSARMAGALSEVVLDLQKKDAALAEELANALEAVGGINHLIDAKDIDGLNLAQDQRDKFIEYLRQIFDKFNAANKPINMATLLAEEMPYLDPVETDSMRQKRKARNAETLTKAFDEILDSSIQASKGKFGKSGVQAQTPTDFQPNEQGLVQAISALIKALHAHANVITGAGGYVGGGNAKFDGSKGDGAKSDPSKGIENFLDKFLHKATNKVHGKDDRGDFYAGMDQQLKNAKISLQALKDGTMSAAEASKTISNVLVKAKSMGSTAKLMQNYLDGNLGRGDLKALRQGSGMAAHELKEGDIFTLNTQGKNLSGDARAKVQLLIDQYKEIDQLVTGLGLGDVVDTKAQKWKNGNKFRDGDSHHEVAAQRLSKELEAKKDEITNFFAELDAKMADVQNHVSESMSKGRNQGKRNQPSAPTPMEVTKKESQFIDTANASADQQKALERLGAALGVTDTSLQDFSKRVQYFAATVVASEGKFQATDMALSMENVTSQKALLTREGDVFDRQRAELGIKEFDSNELMNIKQLWADFVNAGESTGEGFEKGIKGSKDGASNAVGIMADDVKATFKNGLKINSPSRIFMEFGKFIIDGLAEGIRGNIAADDAIREVAQRLQDAGHFKFENLLEAFDAQSMMGLGFTEEDVAEISASAYDITTVRPSTIKAFKTPYKDRAIEYENALSIFSGKGELETGDSLHARAGTLFDSVRAAVLGVNEYTGKHDDSISFDKRVANALDKLEVFRLDVQESINDGEIDKEDLKFVNDIFTRIKDMAHYVNNLTENDAKLRMQGRTIEEQMSAHIDMGTGSREDDIFIQGSSDEILRDGERTTIIDNKTTNLQKDKFVDDESHEFYNQLFSYGLAEVQKRALEIFKKDFADLNEAQQQQLVENVKLQLHYGRFVDGVTTDGKQMQAIRRSDLSEDAEGNIIHTDAKTKAVTKLESISDATREFTFSLERLNKFLEKTPETLREFQKEAELYEERGNTAELQRLRDKGLGNPHKANRIAAGTSVEDSPAIGQGTGTNLIDAHESNWDNVNFDTNEGKTNFVKEIMQRQRNAYGKQAEILARATKMIEALPEFEGGSELIEMMQRFDPTSKTFAGDFSAALDTMQEGLVSVDPAQRKLLTGVIEKFRNQMVTQSQNLKQAQETLSNSVANWEKHDDNVMLAIVKELEGHLNASRDRAIEQGLEKGELFGGADAVEASIKAYESLLKRLKKIDGDITSALGRGDVTLSKALTLNRENILAEMNYHRENVGTLSQMQKDMILQLHTGAEPMSEEDAMKLRQRAVSGAATMDASFDLVDEEVFNRNLKKFTQLQNKIATEGQRIQDKDLIDPEEITKLNRLVESAKILRKELTESKHFQGMGEGQQQIILTGMEEVSTDKIVKREKDLAKKQAELADLEQQQLGGATSKRQMKIAVLEQEIQKMQDLYTLTKSTMGIAPNEKEQAEVNAAEERIASEEKSYKINSKILESKEQRINKAKELADVEKTNLDEINAKVEAQKAKIEAINAEEFKYIEINGKKRVASKKQQAQLQQENLERFYKELGLLVELNQKQDEANLRSEKANKNLLGMEQELNAFIHKRLDGVTSISQLEENHLERMKTLGAELKAAKEARNNASADAIRKRIAFEEEAENKRKNALIPYMEAMNELQKIEQSLIGKTKAQHDAMKSQLKTAQANVDAAKEALKVNGQMPKVIAKVVKLREQELMNALSKKDALKAIKTTSDGLVKSVAQLGIASATLQKSYSKVLNTFQQMDAALTRIAQVSNELNTGEALSALANNAYEAAQRTGIAATQYLEAVRLWQLAGHGVEEASRRAELTAIGTNVTDVANIQTMQKYIHVAENAWGASVEGILNSMNAIENQMPTTANAIGQAMQNAAVSADLVNTSMDEFIALVTAAEAATQIGGQRIGTALNAIATRYSTLLSGIGAQNQERFDALTDLGINIHVPETGELLSFMEVMDEIQQRWGDWTEMERLQVTNFLGGQGSAQTIAAIAENWDDVIKAQEIVLEQMEAGTEGSIFEEQEKAMESMGHKMNEIQAISQQMWWAISDNGQVVIDVLNITLVAMQNMKNIFNAISENPLTAWMVDLFQILMQITMVTAPVIAITATIGKLTKSVKGAIASFQGLTVAKTAWAKKSLIAVGVSEKSLNLMKLETIQNWLNTKALAALTKAEGAATVASATRNMVLSKTLSLLAAKKVLMFGLAGLVGVGIVGAFSLFRRNANNAIAGTETDFSHLINTAEDFRRETDRISDSLREIRNTRVESVLADSVKEEIQGARDGLNELLGASRELVQKTYDDGSRAFEEGEPGPRGGATRGAPIMIEAGLDQEAFYDIQNQVAELARTHEIELEFLWNTPGELFEMLDDIERELDARTMIRLEGKLDDFHIADAEADMRIEELTNAIVDATSNLVDAIIDKTDDLIAGEGDYTYAERNAMIEFGDLAGFAGLEKGITDLEGSINQFNRNDQVIMREATDILRDLHILYANGGHIDFNSTENEIAQISRLLNQITTDNDFSEQWITELRNIQTGITSSNIASNEMLQFARGMVLEEHSGLIAELMGVSEDDALIAKIDEFIQENSGEMWTDSLLNELMREFATTDADLNFGIEELRDVEIRNHEQIMDLWSSWMQHQAEQEMNVLNQEYENLLGEFGDEIYITADQTYAQMVKELTAIPGQIAAIWESTEHGVSPEAAREQVNELTNRENEINNQMNDWRSDNQDHALAMNRNEFGSAEQRFQDAGSSMMEADGGELSSLELQHQELINQQLETRGFINQELLEHTDLMFRSVSGIEDVEERRTTLQEQINRLAGEDANIRNNILSNMVQLQKDTQANVSALDRYHRILSDSNTSVDDIGAATRRLISENEGVMSVVADTLGLLDDNEFKVKSTADKTAFLNDLLEEGNLSSEHANLIQDALLGLIDEELELAREKAEIQSMTLEDFLHLADIQEAQLDIMEFEKGLLEDRRFYDHEREEGIFRMLEMSDQLLELDMMSIENQMLGAELDAEEQAARIAILETLGWQLDEEGNLIELHDTQLQQLEDMIEQGDILVTTVGECGDEMVLFHDATTNTTMAINQAELAALAVAAGIDVATASAAQLAAMMHAAGGAFAAGEAGVAINPTTITPRSGTNRVANAVAPRPSSTPTQRPSSRPSAGSTPNRPSGGRDRPEREGREEAENDSTIDEAVWRFWRLENQIRRVNDEMNRLSNEMSRVGNQMTVVDNQIARARLDENYAQVIALLERRKQLTQEQIRLERQQQGLVQQEIGLQTQLRDAHRQHLSEQVRDLEAHGFRFDANGALLNYEHAKNFVGETAEEVERMLNDWRSTYNTVRDLNNTVDDLNQSLDDSNTSISGMELSLRQMEEEIRQANIEKELRALEGAFRRVELAIRRINNVLSLQNTALNLLSSNDFELGQVLHHHSINQAQESIRDLAEEFNYLISNQSEHEEVSEEVLSRLEELKGSMLENADAVIAYGIALNDLQLERSAADMESFTAAIDRNLNRMNALFSNIREGLLSGQDINDLFADQTVGIEFNRGHNQFLPQFQQRIGMEEQLQNSLDLFAQREIDRTRDVANEQLRIQTEKFNRIIAMHEGNVSSITSITGGQFNAADWQLPGLNDYDIPDHLQAYFDVFDNYYAELRRQRDRDLKEAGDNMQLRNEILEDFAIASMGAQRKLLEQAIAGNNAMIDHYQNRINNAESLGLTGDQLEEYRQRIRDMQDANLDFQQQIRDTVTAVWDLTFERMERVRRQFDLLVETAGHYMNVLNALRANTPERELHFLTMMQRAELARNANLRQQRDELIAQREEVDYMSYEWRRINEQIEEMNSQLRDSDLTLLEQNHAILEANINRLFRGIEEQMFGRSQAEHERFMRNWIEGVERELELEDMARRIIDLERDLHEDQMAMLREQFRLLEEQDKMSRTQLAYMNHHLTLIEAQRRLEEAQNQRNQRRLVQNEDGSFDWAWEADEDALEAAEQAVRDAERELEQFRQQAQLDFMNQLNETIQRGLNENMTEEELRAAIADIQNQFRHVLDDDMMNVEGSIDEILDYMSEFFRDRDRLVEEMMRQELTPQNIGHEVGKAFRDSAQEMGDIIADAMRDALENFTQSVANSPTYDARIAGRSLTPTSTDNSNHYEINIEAQFPAINDALAVKNSLRQLEFEALQRAAQYNGMNNR